MCNLCCSQAFEATVGSELITLEINIKKFQPRVKLSSEEDYKLVGSAAVASYGFGPRFELGLRLFLLLTPSEFRLS